MDGSWRREDRLGPEIAGARPGFSVFLSLSFPLFLSLRSFSLLAAHRRGGREHAVANNTVPAFGSVWEAELTDKIKLFQKPPWFSLSSRRVRLFLSHHSFSSSRARGPTSSFSTLDSLSTRRRVRLSPSSYSLPLAPSLILSFFLSLHFANAISRSLPPLHRSARSLPPPDSLIRRLALSEFSAAGHLSSSPPFSSSFDPHRHTRWMCFSLGPTSLGILSFPPWSKLLPAAVAVVGRRGDRLGGGRLADEDHGCTFSRPRFPQLRDACDTAVPEVLEILSVCYQYRTFFYIDILFLNVLNV